MRFIRITSKNELYKSAKEVYNEAFPVEERAPFSSLFRKSKRRNVDLWAIKDGEKFVGMLYIVRAKEYAYFFYFAIARELRQRGYGGRIIKAVLKKYSRYKLFLARERIDEAAENNDERIKRHEFYLKNGFKDTDYTIREARVVFDAMSVDGTMKPEIYEKLMYDYLGFIMFRLLHIKMEKKIKQ